MSERISNQRLTRGKQGLIFLVAVAATMVMYFSPPKAAAAENFCGVTLQPYGQAGDRCWGASHHIYGVNMLTHERAGCVDIANGSNELLQAWQCVSSSNVSEITGIPNDGVNRKGVVRNNNLSFTGFFNATEFCYTGC
jgi:hypothetical protein